jgi:hypothetical protein
MPLSTFEILKLFKENLADFLNALIERFPSEQQLVYLRIFLCEQIPVDESMKIFSKRILEYDNVILTKDEEAFLKSNDLFEGIPGDKVNYFKSIWLSPTFTKDDKSQMWDWLKAFLKLAKLYKANNPTVFN